MQLKHKAVMGIGVVALAGPAAAIAGPGHGNGHGQTKTAQYNVKGTYVGDGVVAIEKANGQARKAGWEGQNVTFDFASAEIRTDDNNLDGLTDLNDVAAGSPVKIKARLSKGDPGAGPYVAQRLVDESGADDDDATAPE